MPPPRTILLLTLIIGIMTVVRFGEQTIVKTMNVPILPFAATLTLLALYPVPQWGGAILETMSFDPATTTGNGLLLTL